MKKEIVKNIIKLSGKYTTYTVFTDWVKIVALSIANSSTLVHDKIWRQREEQYLQVISKYSKEEQSILADMMGKLIIAFEHETYDILGEIYMEAECGNKSTGQFFTPYHVSELCAGMLLENKIKKDKKGIIINEPSCGGGGMIIAYLNLLKKQGINYQENVKVVAQDIDWNSVYMCYTQLSLLGVKAIVCQGDTLAEPNIREYPKERIFETIMSKLNFCKY